MPRVKMVSPLTKKKKKPKKDDRKPNPNSKVFKRLKKMVKKGV